MLSGYRLHESVEIYERLPPMATLKDIGRSVVIVPRTILRCLRQRSRWPWTEFGIRVAQHARSDDGP